MNVLVACEYSATVADAFRARGWNAWSNDLLPTEGDASLHIQGDCLEAIRSRQWDLIVIHIPCTAMAVCGNSTYGVGQPKHDERLSAIAWSLSVWDAALDHAPFVALENPASVIFPALRERGADIQYVQPWMFGHPEQKKTGFALHGLPPLRQTNNVHEEMMTLPKHLRERVHYMSPGPTRAKERARFYSGIAAAMADQWGGYVQSGREDQRFRQAGSVVGDDILAVSVNEKNKTVSVFGMMGDQSLKIDREQDAHDSVGCPRGAQGDLLAVIDADAVAGDQQAIDKAFDDAAFGVERVHGATIGQTDAALQRRAA